MAANFKVYAGEKCGNQSQIACFRNMLLINTRIQCIFYVLESFQMKLVQVQQIKWKSKEFFTFSCKSVVLFPFSFHRLLLRLEGGACEFLNLAN